MDFRLRHYLANPHRLLAMRRFMSRTPGWDEERLLAWQLERLRVIARHARDHVPYYRQAFADSGFEPEDVRTPAHWVALTTLSKATVRSNLAALQADDARRHGPVWAQTSGSTGTAMRFTLDRHVNMAAFCVLWRHWEQCPGWRIGRRQLVVAGLRDALLAYRRKTRILEFSAYRLRTDAVPVFADAIRRYRPVLLRGYPSALYELACLFEHAGEHFTFPGIVTHSETLLPFQREQIQRAFSGTVLDHYTHWERAGSIGQCVEGRYHAHADYGFHEIVRGDGQPAAPGETGRIIVTGLHNRAMPLLRYDTGDLGAWSARRCACGSPFPVVDRIEGRVDDLVVTPDGRRIGRLSTVFRETPRIRLAQVVQETVDVLTIVVVADPGYGPEDEQRLLDELRARLGDGVTISVRYVEDIPPGPNGKRRLVVSRVGAAPESTG